MRRITLTAALLAVVVSTGLISSPAAAQPSEVTVYQGTIAGAEYRAEVPVGWNGTLVLWSHAAYRFGFSPSAIELTNHPATRQWLLDNGYAVAASKYQPVSSWVVKQALDDQIALLDWFDATVGKPRRTVVEGASMGGLVTTLLAERNPDRFDGVVSLCGDMAGSVAAWNLGLDLSFVFKTLLAPSSNLQLVHISDPSANMASAIGLLREALSTPEGRARLALAGAIADLPPWSSPLQPYPVDLDGQLRQQAGYYGILLGFFLGVDRAGLEQFAGGNPSWNSWVDYRRQLARSSQRSLAQRAYEAAGLDLDADLDRLAATPRIRPDLQALIYQARNGTPKGTTPAPVLTVHTTGDGLTPPENERQYADRVNMHGDQNKLRQLYVERGGHCSFTASEEIVALRAMFFRIETGTWGGADPGTLTDEAREYGPEFQTVHLSDGTYQPVTPTFVAYSPAPFLR